MPVAVDRIMVVWAVEFLTRRRAFSQENRRQLALLETEVVEGAGQKPSVGLLELFVKLVEEGGDGAEGVVAEHVAG